MRAYKSVFILIVGVSIWSISEAEAGWARTDRSAKAIAQAESRLHRQLRRVDQNANNDVVLSRDEKSEMTAEAEARLIDAYMDIIYMAYMSPNRERYLKRLAVHLPGEKVQKMKNFLKLLPKPKKERELHPWIVDSICRQAEILAKVQVKTALAEYRSPIKYAANR